MLSTGICILLRVATCFPGMTLHVLLAHLLCIPTICSRRRPLLLLRWHCRWRSPTCCVLLQVRGCIKAARICCVWRIAKRICVWQLRLLRGRCMRKLYVRCVCR